MESMRKILPFHMGADRAHLQSEWQRWKRELERYFDASGITSQWDKRSIMLHLAGSEVQEIFDHLPGVDQVSFVVSDPPYYDVAIQKLNEHFEPMRRRNYERHLFRQISQKPEERFADFVLRLRIQAKRCEFDRYDSREIEDRIVEQVVEACTSTELRRQILAKDLTLDEIVTLGTTLADVQEQVKELGRKNFDGSTIGVNKVTRYNSNSWTRPRGEQLHRANERACFACGRKGHLKGDNFCRAKNAKCIKCGEVGHFINRCLKRSHAEDQGFFKPKKIRMVNGDDIKEDLVFFMMGRNIFEFVVGGIKIPMIIDSGADANVIDEDTWLKVSQDGIILKKFSRSADRKLMAYATKKPMTIKGMFEAEIEAGDNKVDAKFYIVERGQRNLLGDSTAKQLKVLRVGFDIASVESPDGEIFPKIKDVIVEIPINRTVQPVQQAYRRAPLALEGKIFEKLQYLLRMDIIEKVHGPSPWVSPIVPIVKNSGDIRICVDMRKANQAVLRESHPLPVIEELLACIDGAVKFSKLDIKEAYHQLEISEELRVITTFITKYGLFRYKRLMFGINCAPELFLKVMDTILAGLEGVIVYLDDVMVSGRSQSEHDTRLSALIQRLEEYNVRLNQEKCLFNVDKLEFLGHELSTTALEFTVEPSDTTVPEGNSVLLQCAGRVDPKALREGKVAPNIRWRGPDGQDIGIVGDTFRSQLTNGSLYISTVESNRGLTGFYHCLLTVDGIGTIVSRSARVAIADRPEISQDSHEIYLYAGQTAYFKCMSTTLPFNLEAGRYHVEWLKDESPIRMDHTRMLLLPSGALEIDEVVPADRGTYQCNVTSGIFSSMSSKSNLNIKSTAGQPQSFEPPSFVIVPQPQTVKEGDTVILDCVANGNPKPTIKWLRNGEEIDMNDLDSRFRIIGTGSLQISSIQDVDAGDYQCRASNSEDSLDASATVQVQVPPKFILSPEDKVAYEKEELELQCSIHGKPTPIIQWLKNGDLITPNEYMQIVGGHNLKIFGLIGSDAGMFQCIGTNPAGSVQAAARLEIIEPGQTKRHKSKKFHHNQGKMKSYEKPMHSDPKLSKVVLDSLLSKTKDKANVNHNKFQYDEYTDDDYLEHEEDHDEDEEDTGKIYALRPDEDPNKLYQSLTGSRSSENGGEVGLFSNSYLPNAVTRKYPKSHLLDGSEKFAAPLPGPPRDLQAQIVKPRFITLSWLEPAKNPDEVISYSVYYKMHTSERERKITTKSRDEQEVNIQSLLPGKTYQFRVIGNSNHGSGESSQTLEVRTHSEENIAGPPQNIRGEAMSDKEIHLIWDPPLVSTAEISRYRVYYAEIDNGDELYSDTTSTDITIAELRPYTEYTMYVVPWNQMGMGDPSHEIVVKTHSSVPSEAPSNVTLEAASSTSITIRWQPPPVEDRNGQITGYKIRYRKNKKPLQVETTPANVRHWELKGLDRLSAYQVKIAAMTVNGSGPFSEWHHIETYENDLDESQVPGQPAWIKTRPGAESITVTWASPHHQEIKVRNYILGWGKGIPDEDTTDVEEHIRIFEIRNLEPNTEYVISLRARNNMGDGPPIYDTVRTREDSPIEAPTPLEVPVGLRAIPMSGTSIVVYWTDTTLSKSQHVTDNRYYVVKFTPTASTRIRFHNTTDLNCMIGDLRPSTQYEFAVKVVKGHRQSAWSMSVINSTHQAAPVSPPRDLTVSYDERNPLTAILQWQPPRHSNSPITGYVVLYTTDPNKRDREWNAEAVVGDKTSAEITGLESHTTYYFKVQTRNSKGYGLFSAMVSQTTGADVDSSENLAMPKSISSEMIYVIVGFSILTAVIAVSVVILLCRKKPEGTPEHAKKSYQKNNAGIIKPPDLWIHHDQMELKNLDKSNHSTTPGSVDGGASSSGAMTLPRSVNGHEFDSETPITHVTNSLDKRGYVPGYTGTTTPLSSTMERPQYPRTQYNMASRPHISLDQQTLSQQSLLQHPPQLPPANSLVQTPENPYTYEGNYSNPNVTYAPGMTVDAPKRGQGHPLKSFSVPAPPASTPIISSQGKHAQTPSVTIRPQNSSPYKKPPSIPTNSLTNRLQTGPAVQHSTDEIQRLAPSTSTEELNQEMANLEGLMKDLSAITANEFEC